MGQLCDLVAGDLGHIAIVFTFLGVRRIEYCINDLLRYPSHVVEEGEIQSSIKAAEGEVEQFGTVLMTHRHLRSLNLPGRSISWVDGMGHERAIMELVV